MGRGADKVASFAPGWRNGKIREREYTRRQTNISLPGHAVLGDILPDQACFPVSLGDTEDGGY